MPFCRHLLRGTGLTALLLAGSLSACGGPDEGFVSRQWVSNMREYNIYPLFPPREDVQVGDVYLMPIPLRDQIKPASEEAPLPVGQWISSVNLNSQINAFYAKRPSFAATFGGSGGSPADSGEVPIPTNPAGIFPGGGQSTVQRLKQVAFPEFMRSTATTAEAGAIIPGEALSAAAGISYADIDSAAIKVPAAEYYGLPAGTVLDAFCADPQQRETLRTFRHLPAETPAPRHCGPDSPQDCPTLMVITEVFYARSLDVTLSMTEQAAARLKGELALPAGKTVPGADAPQTPPEQPVPAQAAAAQAQAAASGAITPLNGKPGVSAQVARGGSGSITLSRTYQYPVAIGYRGILIPVTWADGDAPSLDQCRSAVVPPIQPPVAPMAAPHKGVSQ